MYDKNNIQKLYLEGYTVTEISEKTNVSKSYIYYIVKKNNLPKQKRFKTKLDIQKLEEYCATHNLEEIREKWGCNGVRVMYKLRLTHQYKEVSFNERTIQIYQEILENKKSLSEIARLYGISRQRVWQIKTACQKKYT